MSGKFARLITLLLAFATITPYVHAQLPTGTILGEVRDPAGAVVPNATMTLTNIETSLTRNTTTTEDGTYRFPALPVGSYEVRASSPGFQTALRTGLTLEVGQEAVVSFSLAVGELTQVVEVEANAQLVNTTRSLLKNPPRA